MAILSNERSGLVSEITKLKSELKEIHHKYDLLLESSASYFFIFEGINVIEFSPKAEDKFVFASDFEDKTTEELFPIYQLDGEVSKKKWTYQQKKSTLSRSKPFEFEFLDKSGKSFSSLCTISKVKDDRFLAHLDLIEHVESNTTSTVNSIADNAPVFIRVTDVSDKTTYFNKGWHELLDTKGDDKYEKWRELIHTDDEAEYSSSLAFAISKRKKYEYSFRIQNQDGSYKWLLETGTPRYSKNNKFLGYVCAAIDVTDRKNLELEATQDAAIASAESKIQESLDHSEVVALTTDTEGTIRFCNKKLLGYLGTELKSVVGTNLFEIFVPDTHAKINQKKYADLARKGQYSEQLQGKLFGENEEEVHVRFNVIFLKDALNEVSGINLIGENITERQKVKKQLEKSNDQLKELFDNSYDLIQIFDHDGNFQFVNRAWTEKLGYRGLIEDLKFKDIVSPETWEETVRNLDKVIKGENIERFECEFLSDQGKKIFVSGRVNCSFDLKGRAQFRGIFYDITERIRTEKAQSLYSKIGSYNLEGMQLNLLYENLFQELNNILVVRNIYIHIDSGDPNSISYFRTVLTDKNDIEKQKQINKLLGASIQNVKEPKILYKEDIESTLHESGMKHGTMPEIWLGVSISLGDRNIGHLAIYSYQDRSDYSRKDLELLFFISSQISLAVERKLNEEKITDQDARLRAIFQSSSHQIWSVDNDYKLTSFNEKFSENLLNNYGVQVKTGSKLDLHNERLVNQWQEHYSEAFKGDAVNFQSEGKANSDKPLWTEVFINPIVKTNGEIQEVSVIANDITEKKNSEIALAESESKFREIFESIQDIYIRCDLQGRIIMISPSIKSLELTESEVLGKNIMSIFISDYTPEYILNELQSKIILHNVEARLKRPKGQNIDFICNIRLLHRDGKPVAIEGVARDISLLKQTNLELIKAKEFAENSLAIKERFLANMSHEIRTPMNGIIGMIDLMSSTSLDREQYEYVNTIKKSSETLMVILNDILDLSKIEAGKMELREQPVRLLSTFEKLYDLFSQQAQLNDSSISYDIEDDIPDLVMIDETRLLQILSNLTSNAIKFSNEKGTINLSLSLKETKRGKHLFKVQVKDEGIGIHKDEIDKLFVNFNQLDNSSTKSYEGTGLGLAISKELVKSMSGDIGVVSTPGLGSTFWFTFSAGIIKDQKVKPTEKENQINIPKEFAVRTPIILVVDDNKINRTVASQILTKAGCNVKTAESGGMAIDLVKKQNFDLIFMDIQMPEMDGVQTTQVLRSLQKNLPPIVAMTAYSMENDDKKFIEAGLDDYLAKPIRAQLVIDKVLDHVKFKPTEIQEEKAENNGKVIINQDTLKQLSKYGGKELLESILLEFETEAKTLLDNCLLFYDQNEIEEIRKELHTLKGTAGTLGVEILENKVIKLEKQLKKSDPTGLKDQLDSIMQSYQDFKENYRNII